MTPDTYGILNLNAFLSDKNEISITPHAVAIVLSWLPTKERGRQVHGGNVGVRIRCSGTAN